MSEDYKEKYEELLKEFNDLKSERDEYENLWEEEKKEHETLKEHVNWIKLQL